MKYDKETRKRAVMTAQNIVTEYLESIDAIQDALLIGLDDDLFLGHVKGMLAVLTIAKEELEKKCKKKN